MSYSSGEDHYVHVKRLPNTKLSNAFRRAAKALGRRWEVKDSNARSTPGGGMISLGTKKAAGCKEHIVSGPNRKDCSGETHWSGLNKICARLNIHACTIAKEHFNRAYDSIKDAADVLKLKIADYMGGKKGLSPQLVQSGHGFYSESHFDFDLSEYCLAIWNSEDGTDPEGWYFLLPSVEGEYEGVRYEAVAIRLRDGTGIEWCGRKLRHCSTTPIDSLVNVFGTFFAIMSV